MDSEKNLREMIDKIVKEVLTEGYYDTHIPNYSQQKAEMDAYKGRLNKLKEDLMDGVIAVVLKHYPEMQVNKRSLIFSMDNIMSAIQSWAKQSGIRL